MIVFDKFFIWDALILEQYLLYCFHGSVLVIFCCDRLRVCAVTMWSSDPEVGRDVLQLVQCLRLVSDAVSGDMAYEMEKALEHLQSPDRAAELVLENMLTNDKYVT